MTPIHDPVEIVICIRYNDTGTHFIKFKHFFPEIFLFFSPARFEIGKTLTSYFNDKFHFMKNMSQVIPNHLSVHYNHCIREALTIRIVFLLSLNQLLLFMVSKGVCLENLRIFRKIRNMNPIRKFQAGVFPLAFNGLLMLELP